MHNAVAVQVLDGDADLIGQLLNTLLTQLETPELDIIKEVLALHVL